MPGSEGLKYKRNTAELLEQIQTLPEMEGFYGLDATSHLLINDCIPAQYINIKTPISLNKAFPMPN